MVYDNVKAALDKVELKFEGERGFAIHKVEETGPQAMSVTYEIYTDDGHGNGDYLCVTYDYVTAQRIAHALDLVEIWEETRVRR